VRNLDAWYDAFAVKPGEGALIGRILVTVPVEKP
jgi:hypothetical protein